MGTSQSSGTVGKHLTGFDDEVQLGQLGEILENDSAVMSVELVDRDGRRLRPDADVEYRWRGVSMDRYETGRWRRPRLRPNGYTLGLTERWRESRVIRQLIKLEPTDSPVLFGLRPILDADAPDKRFIARAQRGRRLALPGRHPGRLARLLGRLVRPTRPAPARRGLSRRRATCDRLAAMPDELKAQAPADRPGAGRGARPRTTSGAGPRPWSAISASPGEFRYSLQMDVGRPRPRPGRGLPGQPQGRATASTSPAPWPCCSARSTSPPG